MIRAILNYLADPECKTVIRCTWLCLFVCLTLIGVTHLETEAQPRRIVDVEKVARPSPMPDYLLFPHPLEELVP